MKLIDESDSNPACQQAGFMLTKSPPFDSYRITFIIA